MNIEIPDELYERFRQLIEMRPGRHTVEAYVQDFMEHEICRYPPPEYQEVDRLTRCKTRGQLLSAIHYAILGLKPSDVFHNRYLCIDIDDFKSSLDFHGLTAGDQVLIELVRRLRETYPSCNIFRFGGDEFVVELKEEPYVAFQLPLPVRLKHTIVEVEVSNEHARHHHIAGAISVLLDRGMVEARPAGNLLVYRGDDLPSVHS